MASWQSLNTQPSFSADTMLLLTDGTVMVHELNTPNWHRLTPDSLGSYIHGSWSSLASLPDSSAIPAAKGGPTNAPLFFASAVLADGTVFVAGGEYNAGKADADSLTAQLYDPIANSWKALPTPAGWTGIGDAASCVLSDGRLLLGNFESSKNAIFDPTTQLWQAGGVKADSCSEETFTLLPNGNVLSVECSNAPAAEQYIAGSNTWVTAGNTGATLPQACTGLVAEIGPALLLPDGRVFAVGATGATALYTPAPDPTKAGTWTSGPTLKDSQNNTSFPMDVPGVLLPNGKVMVLGAPGPPCNYPSPTTVFLYDPAGNTAAVIPGPVNANGSPYGARMLLLPNGQVLYSASSKDIEVYTPDAGGQASWKPTVTSIPGALTRGQTYQISGTQFNGLSQACSYGDDAQMATNYPIVQLQSGGSIYYLRTFNHSTMGVATGTAIVSTNITIPANVPPGPATVVVIANGIASDPVAVTVSVPPVVEPTALLFAETQVGTTSLQQTVTVSVGSATITGISFADETPGASADYPCVPPPGRTITVENGQVVITVWFRPTAGGVRDARLEIAHNAAGSPLVVELSGTGNAAPIPLLSVAPTTLFFDPKKLTGHTVTLTNKGNAPLIISSMTFDHPNYSVSGSCSVGSGALNPGQQCSVTVGYHFIGPGGSANLIITHNAPGSPTMIGLEATSAIGFPP